jgi:hypothetical protein
MELAVRNYFSPCFGIISKNRGGKRDRENPMWKKDNEVNYRGYV